VVYSLRRLKSEKSTKNVWLFCAFLNGRATLGRKSTFKAPKVYPYGPLLVLGGARRRRVKVLCRCAPVIRTIFQTQMSTRMKEYNYLQQYSFIIGISTILHTQMCSWPLASCSSVVRPRTRIAIALCTCMYTHSKHTSCPSGISTLPCGLMFTGVCVCVCKGMGGGAASSCHGVCMAARVWQGERVLARNRVESKPASELRERESVCVRGSL